MNNTMVSTYNSNRLLPCPASGVQAPQSGGDLVVIEINNVHEHEKCLFWIRLNIGR